MRWLTRAKAVLLLWLSLCFTAAAEEDSKVQLHLQLDQARKVALNALRSGQPRLAFAISEGLVEADPKDGHALYIKAKALGQMRDYDQARKTAAQAYRVANTDLQHYESATLAAQLSFAEARMTHSQVWLRRAAHYAPDDVLRNASIAAFREVRNQNPLSFQLSFSVSPSDNVNNGSNTPFNVIDGVPIAPGNLSASARAISGWAANLSAAGAYRFRETDTTETRIVGRAFLRHVEFNEPVLNLSSSDLAAQRVQLGLAHIWAPDIDGFWRFDANGGRAWFGQEPFFNFASVSAQRVQRVTDNLRLSFSGGLEHQTDLDAPKFDATVWSGIASMTYVMTGGSRITGSVLYRDVVTDEANRDSEQWTGTVRYTHGKNIGPAEISVEIGRSVLDFSQYGFGQLFVVPGGRTDKSWFGAISASFTSASYMGFIPVVTLRSEQSRSNVSRFDVDQTGISVGIRSEF